MLGILRIVFYVIDFMGFRAATISRRKECRRMGRHTPRLKPPVILFERPKPEALGYLEATATATATADPYGMANKKAKTKAKAKR